MKKVIFSLIAIIALQLDVYAQAHTIYDRSSIKCIATALEGSQTLRVQGYGRNRSDAKEQAMKNAEQ